MNPLERFHSLVTAATVVIMFGVLVFLPRFTDGHAVTALMAPIIALLGSPCIYRALSWSLALTLKRLRLLRSCLLGPSYIEGTWVGYNLISHEELHLVVEIVDQDLNNVTLKGESYDVEGQFLARWHSVSVGLDVTNARLIYAYSCDSVQPREKVIKGIAEFDLYRKSKFSRMTEMRGLVADLRTYARKEAIEVKVSNSPLDHLEAIKLAKSYATNATSHRNSLNDQHGNCDSIPVSRSATLK